jgi:hypothetical protein
LEFEVFSANDHPLYSNNKEQYDLITFLDSLHDMGDPTGATAHEPKLLKPDGTVMIVEPFANDKLEDNLNPVGGLFYAGSTMVCVPGSMALNGPALGSQAGETKISEVFKAGGFKQFKRATETQFDIIYGARPSYI